MKYSFNSLALILSLVLVLTGCGPDSVTQSFADFIASMMHRDKSQTQKTLKEELATGSAALPAGYRKVPKVGNDTIPVAGDDDGYVGGSVTFGSRPVTPCGTTQDSVDGRIADCAAANSAMATWDGGSNGNAGQGQWKLVTYNGTHEVWRDERTRLIWSDRLGQANWCQATGSSGGGPYGEADQYGYCDNVAYQPVQSTPESYCTEDASFNTPDTYDSMKGGMRLTATGSSPSVVWRLPTKWDYHQAEIDGIRFPLPNMQFGFWSASVYSSARNSAWIFHGRYATFTNVGRSGGGSSVRCVGR